MLTVDENTHTLYFAGATGIYIADTQDDELVHAPLYSGLTGARRRASALTAPSAARRSVCSLRAR